MKQFRFFNLLAVAIAFSMLLDLPAYAGKLPWAMLTPIQQEALAPVTQEWDSMPEKQQKRLLATTKRYPQFTANEKQRFLARLTEWSKLTPEQRDRAREKYKALSKVPSDKREEIKRMVLQQEAEKISAAASAVENTPEK
jgi:predicted DNA-binding transcriptional regulator YafY